MGRPPIGKIAMTAAERVAKHRASKAVTKPVTKPSAADNAALVAARARISELEAELAKAKAPSTHGKLSKAQHNMNEQKFHDAVNARVREFLAETILPNWRKEQDEFKKLMNARKGVMDKATFNAIRRALHPDSRNSISDKMLGEAFDKFMTLEKRLLTEKDSPTTWGKMTLEEMDARRAATTMKRKAKQGG
jgi:hypothetical protein